MAVFGSLFQLAMVLEEVLEHHGNLVTVELGPPLDTADSNNESARLTLLWTTPQPTHRNDLWERNAAGQLEPPPLTLSVYFLLTTYGNSTNGPEGAYNQLGKALRVFHERPELALPDASLPGQSTTGAGPLTVVQVPMAADLMEKIFSPLQIKHRPWTLFEVGPVQIVPEEDPRPAAPLVRPDGLRLEGPAVMQRPAIERIAPARVGREGWLRIDGSWPGLITEVRIGAESLTPGPSLLQPRPGGPLLVRLPATVDTGSQPLSVWVGNQSSEPRSIAVLADDLSSVDSPSVLVHDPTTDLDLAGHQLATATQVAIWPDVGIAAPDEVRTITLLAADVSATQVTLRSSELSGAQLVPGVQYRISVRISPQLYSPYVLVEVSA